MPTKTLTSGPLQKKTPALWHCLIYEVRFKKLAWFLALKLRPPLGLLSLVGTFQPLSLLFILYLILYKGQVGKNDLHHDL